MLAIGMDAMAAEPFLKEFPSIVAACHNSPESTTVSGDIEDVLALKETLHARNLFARVLETGGNAYHSPHMLQLGGDYEDELHEMIQSLQSFPASRDCQQGPSKFFSSVDISGTEKKSLQASYWRKNLESAVLFRQALVKMIEEKNPTIILEIGPHSALQGPIRQISKSMSNAEFPHYVPTLIRSLDGAKCLLNSAGTLFSLGHNIDFREINSLSTLCQDFETITEIDTGNVIVNLPRYQWQYDEPLYFENRWSREWRFRSHARHDILGSRLPGGNGNEPLWRNVLKQKDLPWLADHKVSLYSLVDQLFPNQTYRSATTPCFLLLAIYPWHLKLHYRWQSSEVFQDRVFGIFNVTMFTSLLP